jgi:ferredoxin--NADP+ reductase
VAKRNTTGSTFAAARLGGLVTFVGKIGDDIFIDKTNYGLLTTDRFENGKDLWLLSTGTGLAPFISIMYDFQIWEQYKKVILVHCVREKKELAYQIVFQSSPPLQGEKFHELEFYNNGFITHII